MSSAPQHNNSRCGYLGCKQESLGWWVSAVSAAAAINRKTVIKWRTFEIWVQLSNITRLHRWVEASVPPQPGVCLVIAVWVVLIREETNQPAAAASVPGLPVDSHLVPTVPASCSHIIKPNRQWWSCSGGGGLGRDMSPVTRETMSRWVAAAPGPVSVLSEGWVHRLLTY